MAYLFGPFAHLSYDITASVSIFGTTCHFCWGRSSASCIDLIEMCVSVSPAYRRVLMGCCGLEKSYIIMLNGIELKADPCGIHERRIWWSDAVFAIFIGMVCFLYETNILWEVRYPSVARATDSNSFEFVNDSRDKCWVVFLKEYQLARSRNTE